MGTILTFSIFKMFFSLSDCLRVQRPGISLRISDSSFFPSTGAVPGSSSPGGAEYVKMRLMWPNNGDTGQLFDYFIIL